MSFTRFVFLFLITGLFTIWLLAAVFFPTDRPRLFIIASGLAFFILAILVFSFGGLIRSFRKLSDSAYLALPVLTADPALKRNVNEIEFVSETFKAVVAELQTKQKELGELHAKLGERVASAEAFSQHVISSLPSGLVAFDLQGIVRVINDPAKEILTLPSDLDASHISYQDLFSSNPVFLQLVVNSLTKDKFISRHELDYQTQDNKKKRIGLTLAPLEVFSKLAGVLCLIADITEINRLKEQIALQRNLESLGLMSAGLAHEFKNSLAALHVYAQFLNRLALDEKGHEAATALTRELRGLSEMVTAFLDFSRPKPLTLATISLQKLLSDCLSELSVTSKEKSVRVKSEGVFPNCSADAILLRQVINNLLHNSFEAVTVNSESNRFVTVRGFQEVDEFDCIWARVEIEDNGNGIRAEDLPFIFLPFFTTKQKGHGIGLALSHRIVTQHGGTLSASNSAAGGALLTLKLKV